MADQICDWTKSNQIPFSREELGTIYVSAIREVGGFPRAKSGLIETLLEPDSIRGTLIVEVEPRDFPSTRPPSRAPLFRLVDQRGLWAFQKRDLAECEGANPNSDLARVTSTAIDACIRVSRLDTLPTDRTDAEYNALIFYAVAGPFRTRQQMHVIIMTLRREGRVAGRSIWTALNAGPLAIDQVRSVCQPSVAPIAFESVR